MEITHIGKLESGVEVELRIAHVLLTDAQITDPSFELIPINP